jgi:hypothetical protein
MTTESADPVIARATCTLVSHYSEIQAICDALGQAAQMEMAAAIECNDELKREHAYGKWLAYRGILRVVEGRTDEWNGIEAAMLDRIDRSSWKFRFPGIERFDVTVVEPGEEAP